MEHDMVVAGLSKHQILSNSWNHKLRPLMCFMSTTLKVQKIEYCASGLADRPDVSLSFSNVLPLWSTTATQTPCPAFCFIGLAEELRVSVAVFQNFINLTCIVKSQMCTCMLSQHNKEPDDSLTSCCTISQKLAYCSGACLIMLCSVCNRNSLGTFDRNFCILKY